MKHLKLPFVAMIAMALPMSGAVVQTVSESFVGSAVSIPGVQGTGERVSLFSLRAVRPALYAGKVTSTGISSIGDTGANWTSALFPSRSPLYAEFANGVETDIQQVNVAAKTIGLIGTLPASVTNGMPYRIREHHTVAEIFGNANQAGLLGGANTSDSDSIRIFVPESQQTRSYFFLNYQGYTGWIADDYSPASNVVIYPEQGLMVNRRGTTSLTLTTSGPLKDRPSRIPVLPGHNLLGVYNRATPVRLDSLNLLSAGFVGGQNPDSGDNVRTFNPDGTSITYFYLNLPGFEGWYDFSYQAAGQVTLAPGTLFILYRRPPNSAFEWTLSPQ